MSILVSWLLSRADAICRFQSGKRTRQIRTSVTSTPKALFSASAGRTMRCSPHSSLKLLSPRQTRSTQNLPRVIRQASFMSTTNPLGPSGRSSLPLSSGMQYIQSPIHSAQTGFRSAPPLSILPSRRPVWRPSMNHSCPETSWSRGTSSSRPVELFRKGIELPSLRDTVSHSGLYGAYYMPICSSNSSTADCS